MINNLLKRLLWGVAALILIALIIITTGVVVVSRREAIDLVRPERRALTRTPADVGIDAWDEFVAETEDGIDIHGWFIPPDPASDGATIIWVHGFTSNREGYLDQAARLADDGYGALLFDLRGHGASGGEVTTFGYSEVADVRAVVDYLLTRPDVNPDKIGIVGGSLGGSVAIRATARIPEIQVMLVQSTFTSIEDNISQGVTRLTGLPAFPFANFVVFYGARQAGVDIDEVRPVDDIDDIAPRPIFIMHGTEDELIEFRNGEALFAAAGEPKQFYAIEGAGHSPLRDIEPEVYDRLMRDFFVTYLPNAAP